MPPVLDPQLKRVLAERIKYYNQLGIYDFYRRPVVESSTIQPEQREQMNAKEVIAAGAGAKNFEDAPPKTEGTPAPTAKGAPNHYGKFGGRRGVQHVKRW